MDHECPNALATTPGLGTTVTVCGSVGLAGAVFAVDLLLPLGHAVWLAYVAFVPGSFWSSRREAPLVAGGVSTLLIALGYVFSPSGSPREVALFNRGLGIAMEGGRGRGATLRVELPLEAPRAAGNAR